jgi:hypothetical protein
MVLLMGGFIYHRFKAQSWKKTMITNVKFATLKRISIKLEDIRAIFAQIAIPMLMQKHLWLNIFPIKSNSLIGKGN